MISVRDGDGDGAGPRYDGNDSGLNSIIESGRRLWGGLVVLAVIGILSFVVVLGQVLAVQGEGLKASIERDQLVSERDGAKRQLEALGTDLAAAKVRQVEQTAVTDKDSARLQNEVAALKTQRAMLLTQIEDLGGRQQEAERRATDAVRHRTEVETELAAARADLARIRGEAATEAKAKKKKAPKPGDDAAHTP